MRYLYSTLLLLLMPLLLLQLCWKARKNAAYRQRLSERLGWTKPVQGATGSVDLWIHAVSLGEVIAATPLVEALLGQGKAVLVTTSTPTGSAALRSRFADRLLHCYLPFDLPFALGRFFKHYQPKLGLIMETELWPNLMACAAAIELPVILANARLSPRSFKGYQQLRWFFKPILSQFREIICQSAEDAERFRRLGASPDQVSVIANIKFDLQVQTIDRTLALACQQRWQVDRPLLMAASTHEGEEVLLLEVLRSLQQLLPGCLLLIAPRHPERFQTVYALAKHKGFLTGLCSQQESIGYDTEVLILDSLGQLLPFYQLAKYAFVGGSWVAVGGHNLLEPIAMGTPVFTGPQCFNFQAIVDALEKKGAIQIVNDAQHLLDAIRRLEQNSQACETMIHQASGFFEANKGAVSHYLSRIATYLH